MFWGLLGGASLIGGALASKKASKTAAKNTAISDAAAREAATMVQEGSLEAVSGLQPYAAYSNPALSNIANTQALTRPVLNQVGRGPTLNQLNTPSGAELTNFQDTTQQPQDFKYQFNPNSLAAKYALARSQESINRAAARNRQLLSGNRMQALNRDAIGQYALDTQNQFNRQLAEAQFNAGIARDRFGRQVTENQLNNQNANTLWNRGLTASQFDNQRLMDQNRINLTNQGFDNASMTDQFNLSQAAYQNELQRQQYLANIGLQAQGGIADYKYRTGADMANIRAGQAANTVAANMFAANAAANAWNNVGSTAGYLGGLYLQNRK